MGRRWGSGGLLGWDSRSDETNCLLKKSEGGKRGGKGGQVERDKSGESGGMTIYAARSDSIEQVTPGSTGKGAEKKKRVYEKGGGGTYENR